MIIYKEVKFDFTKFCFNETSLKVGVIYDLASIVRKKVKESKKLSVKEFNSLSKLDIFKGRLSSDCEYWSLQDDLPAYVMGIKNPLSKDGRKQVETYIKENCVCLPDYIDENDIDEVKEYCYDHELEHCFVTKEGGCKVYFCIEDMVSLFGMITDNDSIDVKSDIVHVDLITDAFYIMEYAC